MNDHVRVTIMVDSPRGYAIEGIQRDASETIEQYAARVTKRMIQLQENPSRLDR